MTMSTKAASRSSRQPTLDTFFSSQRAAPPSKPHATVHTHTNSSHATQSSHLTCVTDRAVEEKKGATLQSTSTKPLPCGFSSFSPSCASPCLAAVTQQSERAVTHVSAPSPTSHHEHLPEDDDSEEDVPLAAFLFTAQMPSAGTAAQREVAVNSTLQTQQYSAQRSTPQTQPQPFDFHHNQQQQQQPEDVNVSASEQASGADEGRSCAPSPSSHGDTIHSGEDVKGAVDDAPFHVEEISASSPNRARRLTQTTLDLGQRGGADVGQRCPLCHMLYNAHSEDVALHRRVCRSLQQQRRQQQDRGTSTTLKYGASDFSKTDRRSVTPLEGASCESSRGIATVKQKREAKLRAGHEAVALLEKLLGSSLETPLHATGKRTTFAATTAAAAAAAKPGIARSLRKTREVANRKREEGAVWSCTQVPVPANAIATHPLAAAVLRFTSPTDGHSTAVKSSTSAHHSNHNGNSATEEDVQRLLHLVGFLSHCGSYELAPQSENVSELSFVCVFVVDAALRLPLCAVMGMPQQREQDPELRIEQRDDGRTLCGTQRRFTKADVMSLHIVSAAVVQMAQEMWLSAKASAYTSTKHALQQFFKVADPTRDCHNDRRDGADENDVEVEKQRQLAVGVALGTLARHLLYGQTLNPMSEFSFARSALRACAEESSAIHHCSAEEKTEQARKEKRVREEQRRNDGAAWFMTCLHTATAFYSPANETLSGKVTELPRMQEEAEEEERCLDDALFVHEDNEEDVSEEENSVGWFSRNGASTTDTTDTRKRLREPLWCDSDEAQDEREGDSLSVVSYSSQS